MLKNYFKIAWRNLMKNKTFSFINILGLTIGITVCLLIFLFVMNEMSYDNFHVQGKNIYQVMRGFDTTKPPVPYLSGPYGDALLNDYPDEIKKAVRIMPTNELVAYGEKTFNEKKTYLADADFFTVFSFPLLKGNPATALKDPNSVVLTQTTARKYFGEADPMGKTLEIDKHLQLKVTGIAKDVPTNSHLEFDMVHPLSIYYNEPFFKVWINNNNFTYVLLDKHASKEKLEKSFPAFMNKYMGADMQKFGYHFSLSLEPLKNIYFQEQGPYSAAKHGDKKIVYIFLSIAALILLIACINFMNLSTIRAVERSKEVGLRKVMGALRNHLVWQFIGESLLLTFISCILSAGLLQLAMPLYNQLLGYDLTVSWNTMPLYLFMGAVILVAGFLAGSYPAFFLSAFSPVQALKGKLRLGKGASLFRQSLVVIQFSISVFLIAGVIIIMSQMHYIRNKDLGYNSTQTAVIPITNNDLYEHLASFKTALKPNTQIVSVSGMSGEPGGFFDTQTFDVEGQQLPWKAHTEFADFEFVKTLGLKLIAGRDFSATFPTDTLQAVLINRYGAAALGYTPEQAIGKWIKNTVRDSTRRKIVGVIEDFNFLSLKQNMDALVISPSYDRRVVLVKIAGGNIPASLASIKQAYNKVSPGYPFEYNFLDQQFEMLYKKDLRQQSILSIFAGLAIFIACLGLFGLAMFTATKRTKEIGVRKVLGSSVKNIVLLLSRDLLKPVLLASVIAMPIAYYAMTSWLQNFAYRTGLHWWIFVLPALLTIAIALFTISFQAIKAAVANPVKSLRTE